jgi:hypothetical protein
VQSAGPGRQGGAPARHLCARSLLALLDMMAAEMTKQETSGKRIRSRRSLAPARFAKIAPRIPFLQVAVSLHRAIWSMRSDLAVRA